MPTEHPFNAEEFLKLLNRGAFDGRLVEELDKLSTEKLEQVALLMAKPLREKPQ